MATRLFAFEKSPKLAVFTICAVKLAITIAIWKEKTNQMSFLQILELASSTLTDWMWTFIAAYVMLHYIGYGFCSNPRAHRRGSTISSRSSIRSISSFSSVWSSRSGRSISSNGSRHSDDSRISRISVTSTTISIIDTRTRIPNIIMDRFLVDDNYQFEADMGRMQGMHLLDPVTELYLRRAIPGGAGYQG
ncbi:hypothetical protein TWF281_004365 [Arthrobotrys megalospora]